MYEAAPSYNIAQRSVLLFPTVYFGCGSSPQNLVLHFSSLDTFILLGSNFSKIVVKLSFGLKEVHADVEVKPSLQESKHIHSVKAPRRPGCQRLSQVTGGRQ